MPKHAASVGQVERVIQLAISQQSGIGGDRLTAKLQQQTAVEIEPQRAVVRFTRRSPIAAPFDPPQAFEFYLRTVSNGLKIAASSGECGLKLPPLVAPKGRVRCTESGLLNPAGHATPSFYSLVDKKSV